MSQITFGDMEALESLVTTSRSKIRAARAADIGPDFKELLAKLFFDSAVIMKGTTDECSAP
jgi:hypothetical protein